MDNDWAYNQIIGAKLWDARCYRNLARACQLLAENAGISFSHALGSVRKSVSRILHHEKTQQTLDKALPAQMPVLLIQDREADVFAFMAAPRRTGLELLVRMAHPHRVVLASAPAPTHLQAALLAAPIEESLRVFVGARPGQPEREALLDRRRVLVGVCPPRNDPAPRPAPLFVWALAATEANPPAGVVGIAWFLLSSLPVPDSQMAAYLVGAYAKRSRIEPFHYGLKSGLGFERLQVDTLAGLQKALSVLSIVAWRRLHLLYLARHIPRHPPRRRSPLRSGASSNRPKASLSRRSPRWCWPSPGWPVSVRCLRLRPRVSRVYG